MSINSYNTTSCIDCSGRGYIRTTQSNSKVSCIICNGSGTTSHGPKSEAEKVFLFKLAWDYINGKEKGWYH
jgi:DnaJ-class molecular chaperone